MRLLFLLSPVLAQFVAILLVSFSPCQSITFTECCWPAVDIMLVSLSLSLALLTSPVPSCLLGTELAFLGARKAGNFPSKREDHRQLVNTQTSLTADTVIGGQFGIYLHWFVRKPESQLTCAFHYTAVMRYPIDKLTLMLALEIIAFVFFLQLYSL